MSMLVDFYKNESPNYKNFHLKDMWDFSDEYLEDSHDYIQWMFPIMEASMAVPGSPVMNEEDLIEFNTDELREHVLSSTNRILKFYGLEFKTKMRDGFKDIEPEIIKAKNYDDRKGNWQSIRNHNHLRLTRILKCLMLCGLDWVGHALHYRLLKINEENSCAFMPETVNTYWKDAIERKGRP